MTFGERVRAAIGAGARLCVGIDPHESLLGDWGLANTADGAEHFGLQVVEAAASAGVRLVKPQIAFYERFGSAGYVALERVLAAARSAELLVIGDIKRGDIGTTQHAYAEAWLTPDSPLEVDAITVSPYLGVGALHSTFALADANGKGTFTLVATSNPEAAELQTAHTASGPTVAADVLEHVSAYSSRSLSEGAGGDQGEARSPEERPGFVSGVTRNSLRRARQNAPWSSHGFVIGATVDLAERGLPTVINPVAPILAPGFGHQGASAADLESIFGDLAPSVIVSESRSVLSAGPRGLVDAMRARL